MTVEFVGARTAVPGVVAAVTFEDVVAGTPVQAVGARATGELVATGATVGDDRQCVSLTILSLTRDPLAAGPDLDGDLVVDRDGGALAGQRDLALLAGGRLVLDHRAVHNGQQPGLSDSLRGHSARMSGAETATAALTITVARSRQEACGMVRRIGTDRRSGEPPLGRDEDAGSPGLREVLALPPTDLPAGPRRT